MTETLFVPAYKLIPFLFPPKKDLFIKEDLSNNDIKNAFVAYNKTDVGDLVGIVDVWNGKRRYVGRVVRKEHDELVIDLGCRTRKRKRLTFTIQDIARALLVNGYKISKLRPAIIDLRDIETPEQNQRGEQ